MTNEQPKQIDCASILNELSQSDGERRKAAEAYYNSIPAMDRLSLLGTAIYQKELPESSRVFAAVLLRRLIIASWKEIQSVVPPQQLLMSCNGLLNFFKNSLTESVEIRDKMCQVIAVLGKSYVDEATQVNQWTDCVHFVLELMKSPHLELREAGYVIFSSCPSILGQANNQTAYIEQVHQSIMESLNFKGKPDSFYVTTTSATAELIISNASNKSCIQKLSTLAMPLVDLLKHVTDESAKEDICQSLIEIAEEAPLSLRPAITQLMQTCLLLMNDSNELVSELRFTALELAVSIIENAPVMVKKRAPGSIKPIILRILAFMASIEDEPEWYESCTNDKDDDEPNAIGESALDRIANALGGKVLLPILMEELTEMLRRPDWQSKHAAIMAFSCTGEGCHDQLMKVLDRIVNGILNFLGDPHPRVRHAACNAIGQMATDFSPEFETKFHAQVIPALCRLLADFSNIRVQAHSACAMINFFEECPQDILSNYLEHITEHIRLALTTYMNQGLPKEEGKLFVVENVIVALSSVADSSAESFINYYDKFMPCLKFIIKESTGKDELRVLRGKSIECVSLIGMAVGKEKFCADASDIMQLLLANQTGSLKLADDDPQASYMMAAWARICRILGPAFSEYLPYVMVPVLQAASQKVEIALLNEEDKASIEKSSDWESISVEDHSLGIKTAGLEDKATACSMLVCYARELKHDFVNYVVPTVDVLIPLLKFPFSDDVRCAAAEALPYLLESAKPKGDQFVLELWGTMFDNLVAAINGETDFAMVNQLMDSLGSCLETINSYNSMNTMRFEVLTNMLNEKFQAHFEYLTEEIERRKDEDYETESDCSDESDDMLPGISAVIHSLFFVFKGDYLPYFQPLVDHILKLSLSEQVIPSSNKLTALLIADDLIEFTGPRGIEYQNLFLTSLSRGIVDSDKEVRQAALYGVGQLAKQNGATFKDYFQTIIPHIVQLINSPQAREEETLSVTENGISAVGRILEYCPQVANHTELLKCWVDWLPIWHDEEEVPDVMMFLLKLINQNNPTVMGPNSSNLPRLVAIVAEVFARSVIDVNSDVGGKMVYFLKEVRSNPTYSSCLGTLTLSQQKAVEEVTAR